MEDTTEYTTISVADKERYDHLNDAVLTIIEKFRELGITPEELANYPGYWTMLLKVSSDDALALFAAFDMPTGDGE